MMSEELKPCPFCGENKLILQEIIANNCYVKCLLCITDGPVGENEQEAIDAWNKRANNLIGNAE
jgi:Lar family restriction alleviation protein